MGSAALLLIGAVGWNLRAPHNDSSSGALVTLSGGFELRSHDYGRPVPLYASMLGVEPDTFRQAFSGVHPDPSHDPSGAEQETNKAALLEVLAQHDVTNERLDEVANYYRFNDSKNETWPRRTAKVYAIVKDGKVTGFRLDDVGVGYTYPPTVSVSGHPEVRATVRLAFTKDFATNGHVESVDLVS
ncbi:hypothetical protein KRMM14A1259_51140 [Krasilnikovia sp. MM14-A1259]